MAFLNLEDLVGNVEIVVFPKDYERYGALLQEDAKIFVKGRVSVEEDKDGKVICEQIVSFEEAAEANGGPIFKGRGGRGSNGGYGGSGYGGNAGYGYSSSNYRNQNNTGYGNASATNGNQGVKDGVGNGQATKVPKGIWIQFSDANAYFANEEKLFATIADSDGNDDVVVFLKDTKAFKALPPNRRVKADEALKQKLDDVFGAENVKIR